MERRSAENWSFWQRSDLCARLWARGVRLEESSCDVHCDRLRTRRRCHSWPRSTPRPRCKGLAVNGFLFAEGQLGDLMRSGLCVTRTVRRGPVGLATRWGSQLSVGAAGEVLEAPAVDAERTSPELGGAETRKISGEIIRSIASTQACQAPHRGWWGQEKPLLQPWDRSASSGTTFPSLKNFPY